jgi:hypothetical protein
MALKASVIGEDQALESFREMSREMLLRYYYFTLEGFSNSSISIRGIVHTNSFSELLILRAI